MILASQEQWRKIYVPLSVCDELFLAKYNIFKYSA